MIIETPEEMLRQSDLAWIFKEMSHISIVTDDIDKAIAGYETLGFEFVRRQGDAMRWRPGIGLTIVPGIRSAWSVQGPPHIEIAEVADSGPMPTLWPSRGHDYVDHTGYWVDDLPAASALLEGMGCPLEMTPGQDGKPKGFCYHRLPTGVRIEIEDGPARKKLLRQQIERMRSGDNGVQGYVPYAEARKA